MDKAAKEIIFVIFVRLDGIPVLVAGVLLASMFFRLSTLSSF